MPTTTPRSIGENDGTNLSNIHSAFNGATAVIGPATWELPQTQNAGAEV